MRALARCWSGSARWRGGTGRRRVVAGALVVVFGVVAGEPAVDRVECVVAVGQPVAVRRHLEIGDVGLPGLVLGGVGAAITDRGEGDVQERTLPERLLEP